MASYSISISRSAEKELRKVPHPYLKKIIEKIKTLSANPRPEGIQMLKGEDRYFRLRQGDWRLVYEVNDAEKKVTITKIGHRREVYDR